MSDNEKQPDAEVRPPEPPSTAVAAGGQVVGGPEAAAQRQESTQTAASKYDLVAELKRRLEETRLPADLKEQILADLPPPEVRERLYRALQEIGGLSSEEFIASLDLDAERRP
jgi:hypothetical protein